ncbi:hypothetical protein BCR32DRAFT_291435 [Anaeromyces robustus]|uniref:DUF998 domain-containing protein n=1 Tax=Anaeromyces robustus TaxID=1754192 RepID=A0A1Y1XEV4_9FUNG|nr:hypothetical protein BCR32DRAFT_291435 [Anaeromyces robustus]|eukprot:ORX84288.1 hypothetical protein BCR32DRAFT_291435 [Anaeromyces robustus]
MDKYTPIEKRLRLFGIFSIIGLLSYTAMVLFSPLAYPGYDWKSMAVSDLSADDAPSKNLAHQLNSLYGPCSIVSIMAICVVIITCPSKLTRYGIYSFALMEWISEIGYSMFSWIENEPSSHPQNIMHLIVTILVVLFSLAALILIAIGTRKLKSLKSLSIWAIVCLVAMLIGPIGTGLLPKSVFGIFERFSTFSAVIFNTVLGVYLMKGNFIFNNNNDDDDDDETNNNSKDSKKGNNKDINSNNNKDNNNNDNDITNYES